MKSLHPEDDRYQIDTARKVFVYKNLHKDCWSVKQDGLVKSHVKRVCLWDCSFRVNKKGRERVIKEKRKNVHAGISGYVDGDAQVMETLGVDWESSRPNTSRVTYNPYKHETFVDMLGDPVYHSPSVKLETGESRLEKDEVRFVPHESVAA